MLDEMVDRLTKALSVLRIKGAGGNIATSVVCWPGGRGKCPLRMILEGRQNMASC